MASVVAILVASPFLIWVQTYDGLAGYFTEGIRFSAREAERSAWTDLPTLSLDHDKPLFRRRPPGPVMQVPVYAPDEGLRLRPNGVATLFYLSWLLPVIALAALVLRWRTLPDTVRAPVAMTVVLHLAMNMTLLRDPFDMRVRDLIIPISALVGFLLGLAWNTRSNLALRLMSRVGVCAMVVAFVMICGAIGDVSRRLEVIDPDYTGDGLLRRVAELNRNYGPPYERTGREIGSSHYAPLVHYVTRCTPPEARILSLTFAPEVLFYTRRGFAGGQVALTQGYYTTDRDAALLLERMGREDVPLVLMDSESEHDIDVGYPTIMSLVHSRYREVLRTKAGADKDFILLARTDRRAVRTDGGLPCFTPASR
jgi:hypothetical protein